MDVMVTSAVNELMLILKKLAKMSQKYWSIHLMWQVVDTALSYEQDNNSDKGTHVGKRSNSALTNLVT